MTQALKQQRKKQPKKKKNQENLQAIDNCSIEIVWSIAFNYNDSELRDQTQIFWLFRQFIGFFCRHLMIWHASLFIHSALHWICVCTNCSIRLTYKYSIVDFIACDNFIFIFQWFCDHWFILLSFDTDTFPLRRQ